MLKLKLPILWPPDAENWFIWKDLDSGKDWRHEEKGMTEDKMVGWPHWLNGHEFEQALGVGDGQGSLACYSLCGCKESEMSEGLNWTEFWGYGHFNNINSSSSRAEHILPFLGIIFNFLYQCFIVFRICVSLSLHWLSLFLGIFFLCDFKQDCFFTFIRMPSLPASILHNIESPSHSNQIRRLSPKEREEIKLSLFADDLMNTV